MLGGAHRPRLGGFETEKESMVTSSRRSPPLMYGMLLILVMVSPGSIQLTVGSRSEWRRGVISIESEASSVGG